MKETPFFSFLIFISYPNNVFLSPFAYCSKKYKVLFLISSFGRATFMHSLLKSPPTNEFTSFNISPIGLFSVAINSSSSKETSLSSSQESSSSSETISSSSKPNTSVQPQPTKRGCGGNINSCYYLLGIALVAVVVIVKRIKQKNN